MNEQELFINFSKELGTLQHRIGVLETELSYKDKVIAGLTAQLALAKPVEQVIQATTTAAPITQPVVEVPIEDVKAESEEVEIINEEVVTLPKKKAGRPKGSKNIVKNPDELHVFPGGSVFTEFEPLKLDKIVVEGANTSAYIPRDKRSYNDQIAAIAAGLGSSGNI